MDPNGWIQLLMFFPLLVCSVVGFALTLAKWHGTRPGTVADAARREAFLAEVRGGHYRQAAAMATPDAPPDIGVAATLLRAIGASRARLNDRTAQLGRALARRLEYGLGGLALIATLGPLFGLLGTVVGIIVIFGQLSAAGDPVSPQQLAGGIGIALYTTVGGLLIGVLALVSHAVVAARVDRLLAELEVFVAEVIDLVCGDDA